MYRMIFLYLAVMNFTAVCVYGTDKKRAIRNQWRISEKTLLMLAVIGGGPGALLGMKVFHHKTKKPKFYLGIPVILILEVLAAALFLTK